MVTPGGYTESTEPEELILEVLSFQVNLLKWFKSPTPTNQVDLKNGDLPPKQVDPYREKTEKLLFDKCLLYMHIYNGVYFHSTCLKDLCMNDETKEKQMYNDLILGGFNLALFYLQTHRHQSASH